MKQATAHHPRTPPPAPRRAARSRSLALVALVAVLLLAAPHARAQRRFSKDYPAQPNIRLRLLNRSGRIEVVGWEKNTVRVTAVMESRSAKMEPEVSDDGVRIDVRRDNREDVG